jgi:hypothetical protein
MLVFPGKHQSILKGNQPNVDQPVDGIIEENDGIIEDNE